jgi:thiamine pyrophosphate-dependent acetolactate synthase large subunit-like protein
VVTASDQPTRLTQVTGGEVVVAAMALHDVRVVFGIPGTHNLTVFDALTRYGIRTVGTTHEQGAGFAADGYARTTGHPGVAVVTSGPAVYNAATAVAQAYSDSIPMLLVSPGMPRTLPVGGPGSGYLHEAKDQTGAMDRIAARCLRATTHQQIADMVAEAFTAFSGGRQRPIHLEVPLDLLEEVGDAQLRHASKLDVVLADSSLVAEAARRLSVAVRPVIVAGGGARSAPQALTGVAERLAAPVATTINGKGAVDESHRLSLGSRMGSSSVLAAADQADVLLIVGSEVGNSDLWQGMLAPRGHVVRVDIDPQMANVNVSTDTMLVGDAAAVLGQLDVTLDDLGVANRSVPSWVDSLRDDAIAETASAGEKWAPWMAAIDAARDDDAIVATDNAMCVYFGAIPSMSMDRPSSFHFPTGFGTLGYTVPVAVGAALAAPDRQVIGITGDGGLLFTATELAVAAAEQLPVAIVVFDNSGYGEIRAEMLERAEKPLAVDAPPRDLVLLARALGAHAVRIDTPDQLSAEIRAAADRRGPTVLVVAEPAPPEGSAR